MTSHAAVVDAAAFNGNVPCHPTTKRGKLLESVLGGYSAHVHLCDVLTGVFRALKPGAHALVSALPATADLTGLGLRAAGFEVRDVLSVFSANGRVDWFLCRRPLEGTVAGNVLKYGCGGVNIDGCRLPIADNDEIHAKNPHTLRVGFDPNSPVYKSDGKLRLYDVPEGRFPTHTILTHHSCCEPCGTKKVKGAHPTQPGGGDCDKTYGHNPEVYGDGGFSSHAPGGYVDGDGTETIQAFSCAAYCSTCNLGFTAKSGGGVTCPRCRRRARWCCPVAALDEESLAGGIHSAGCARNKEVSFVCESTSYNMSGTVNLRRLGDIGGASRFFPCFVSGHEALRWMVRMIGCQPGSTILDPFENCKVQEAMETEGFRYVGKV